MSAILLAIIAIAGGVSYFALRLTELKIVVLATDPIDQGGRKSRRRSAKLARHQTGDA